MSHDKPAKRRKWRLPCDIVYEGGRQRSVVLDLSETGLFVQTGARLRPGAEVEVRLALARDAEPLVLRARVAWTKQIPTHLTSVARGGVGLALIGAPKEYRDAIAALQRSQADSEKPAPTPAVKQRFRVRVKQSEGPRSRTIVLEAETPEQAHTVALRETGAGWEVMSSERIPD